jgi:iron-sulfur cluster repair protein YtfE (RIC family)
MTRQPCLVSLSQDHHRGITLAVRCRKQALGQIRPAGAEALQKQAQELSDFFLGCLRGHFRAEEGVLFPMIAKADQSAGLLIESLLQDHEEIRRNITRLSSERGLGKLLFALGDLLERHIRREERELFPLVINRLVGRDDEKIRTEMERLAGMTDSP